jgi:hypothetical protein
MYHVVNIQHLNVEIFIINVILEVLKIKMIQIQDIHGNVETEDKIRVAFGIKIKPKTVQDYQMMQVG